MAGGLSLDHPWVFTVGMLGNIISFLVYLAPLATFYRVYKKKSTEGFQSVPYIIALFSASLWIYYALVKDENSSLLVTINSIGCFIESIYVILFLIYAPKDAKIFTLKMVVFLNIGLYGLILLLTILLTKGSERTVIVGWICVGFSVSVFAAPLSIIRLVIKTKSVEFMPFSLSCSLTVSAVVWFLYGLLTKDRYVAMPNVLGFGFGVLQMVLYIIYKDVREVKEITQEIALPGHIITINVGTTEVHPIGSNREEEGKGDGEEQKAECAIKESMGGHQESMEHEV